MEEVIRFHHSRHVAGVGVLDAEYTERHWHVVNSAFGLAVPNDWVAQLRYRGRDYAFGRGDLFCTEPGEVHATSRILRPGSFKVLVIDDQVLASAMHELAPHLETRAFRDARASMASPLGQQLAQTVAALCTQASALETQSLVTDLLARVIGELIDDKQRQHATPGPTPALERARECLHESEGEAIDLETLAREAGLSRFHLLRVFKQHYGLPPHAYQVGLRIAKAQRLLRAGMPLAHVAVECGFSDQSHLTRHFKQALGVTPGRFARGLRLDPRKNVQDRKNVQEAASVAL